MQGLNEILYIYEALCTAAGQSKLLISDSIIIITQCILEASSTAQPCSGGSALDES